MVATLAMTMSRRQNSSCDQCRKGKRACDAVWLRDRQLQRTIETNGPKGSPGLLSHGGPGTGSDDDFDLVGPCTNCARTNKHCTFEWVQSQQIQRKERLASSNVSTAPAPAPKKGGVAGVGLDAQSTNSQSPTPSSMPLRPLRPSMMPATYNAPAQYPFSAHDQQMLMNSCSYPNPHQAGDYKMPSNEVTGVAFVDGSLTTDPPSMGMPCSTSCLSLDTIATTAQPSNSTYMDVGVLGPYGLGPFGPGTAPTSGYNDGPIDDSGVSAAWSSPAARSINSPTQMSTDDHQLGMQQMRKRRRTQSPGRTDGVIQQTPLWDLAGGNRLARSANGIMIGETMMRIYHDVMEGALSCWLTEQTCPYNSLPSTPSSTSTCSTGMSATPGPSNNPQQHVWGTFEDMQREWGANWSNRIYRRVIKLDKMAHMLGLKRLAPSDERKVSAALNAAVMAFTAQWAQSSQRSNARWPPNGGPEVDSPYLEEEFDRTLQKSFWNQARKSLSECSEIDSFRVVFAEIIFGLTQKYREDAGDGSRSMVRIDESIQDSTSEKVEEILREDTQQVWLERATRRLHVLRRGVELHDRQLRNKKGIDHSAYDVECRKTIDLLFWLAIMFDTISAAMTERPLTISDEDSSNLVLAHSTQNHSMLTDPSKRWNVILAKDQQTKVSSLRWPCTDAEIAQELTDAAPVKVLLYRKVTLLQTLVARAADARSLEAAIADTLMVYGHWQAIYSAIFADCLAHHMVLSARIQSWYVCLFGHWLLATLIVADLVEVVDARGMGVGAEARRRAEEGTVARIRSDTVRLVAALAKASTPQHDEITGAGELDYFHHAVSDGALLTEPWTMILLRVFSKTAILLLEESENIAETRARGAEAKTAGLDRCEDCIKALWYLGRKSDMAREVSQVLGGALQRARMEAAVHGQ
ncbi:hypothetical protein N0V82_010401 [Gnomoniopsis sp. IMI 355080]|nr:hypothetical protein N0V82_010401 [Gnomoniopsis sp. IMI 355080]